MNSTATLDDWKQRAAALSFRNQVSVNGAFVEAASTQRFDCINPANRELITRVAECDAGDMSVPFSGYKQSRHATGKYVERKTSL